jgi:cytochrome c553
MAEYVAYVPRGSIARGRTLAVGDRAGVKGCTSCHGADLRGVQLCRRLRGAPRRTSCDS